MMNVLPAETELIVAHILFGTLHRFLNSSLVNFFFLFHCAPDNFGLTEAVRALSVV